MYESSIDPLLAEEELRTRGGSMTTEQLRRAVYLKTGDAREADRAAAERELARSRQATESP